MTTSNLHVVTAFSRPQNYATIIGNLLPMEVFWHPLHHEGFFYGSHWINPMRINVPEERATKTCGPLYYKMNQFIEKALIDHDYYASLCDDDLFDPDWEKTVRPLCDGNAEVIVTSMRWPNGQEFIASPRNMRRSCISHEQMIFRGDILSRYRYANAADADGRLAEQIVADGVKITYCPQAHALFNALQPAADWDLWFEKHGRHMLEEYSK